MNSVLKWFLVFILLCTLGFSGNAQEFPFIYFPNKEIASGEVFAFYQNQNKEIVFVNREGAFFFSGKSTRKIISFSQEKISGIKQALFTQDKLVILSNEGLVFFDLRTSEKETVETELTDQIYYHPEKEQLFLSSKGSLSLFRKMGNPKRILEKSTDIQQIFFGENETILVGERNVSLYDTGWDLRENFRINDLIIDSYFTGERLLVLTGQGIYSLEGSSGLKRIQNISHTKPTSLLEDQTGRIWVGTKEHGLLLYDGNQRKTLNHRNNFSLSKVNGIYQSKDFSVWFYGPEGIVFKSFSDPLQKYRLGVHLQGHILQDIKALDTNQVGVLSADGYYHLFENEILKQTKTISLPFVPAFSRIINDQKTLHISKKGDVFLYSKQEAVRNALSLEILQVFTFRNQSVLIDLHGSVHLLDHQKNKIKKDSWKAAIDKPLFQAGELLIYTDDKGKLFKWSSQENSHKPLADLGDDRENLALFDQEHFIFLANDQQLKYSFKGEVQDLPFQMDKNEKVTHFFCTKSDLWISTEEYLYQVGISRKGDSLKLQEVNKLHAAEYDVPLPVFKSIENEEGSYWLASEDHLVLYNTLSLAPDVTPPGIVLSQILVKSQDSVINIPFSKGDSVKINLQRNDDVFIHAYAINYDLKNKASLKFKTSVNENRWKESLEEDFIHISNLQAGTNIIEVVAENEQGVKSEEKILLVVQVSQEMWWNEWILFSASLSLMLLGYFAYSGIQSVKAGKNREGKERYEKELQKLQRQSHEQRLKADGLKQVNELISVQKAELEEKNKQIVAQKYELSLTNQQIKKQKDLIEKTTEKLQSSINYAQRIQTALMGDEIQIKEDLPESFVFFKPRDQVSGDFFWFEKTRNQLGEEVLIIAAVDCTGHGVPGAIVSVVGIKLLNSIVRAKGITDPGQILVELDQDLLNSLKYEQTKINDGMDMALCTINMKQKKVYFAGAKNPLYIIENGELEIIKGDRTPIGGQKLRAEKSFQTHEISLKEGGKQMFYLFTDGYQDQFGGPDKFKFLMKNFKSLLLEISSLPMIDQKYKLAKTINEWQGEEDQTDDILVLGFRI